MKLVQPIDIVDNLLLSTNVSETLYPPYDSGYVFSKGSRVSVIGASGTNKHKVYESLVDNNLGNDPEASTSSLKWIYVSVTNPWLMFDKSVTTQTENQDSIEVSVWATGRNPCLALLNLSAAEAHVEMVDELDGVVYSKTFSLVSDSGIDDWYSYFFEPVVRLTDLVVLDMPAYASPVINVRLSATAEKVKCGALLLGPPTSIGETFYGAEIGIQDFSVKQQDDFGNYSIVERAFRKTAIFTVGIDAVRVDTLQALLATLRSIPVIYIGSDGYTSTVIYGFYKDFKIQIAYVNKSICTLEIEGLT